MLSREDQLHRLGLVLESPSASDMGIAYGSLCHFDLESGSAQDRGEVELLQDLGSMLYPKIAGELDGKKVA